MKTIPIAYPTCAVMLSAMLCLAPFAASGAELALQLPATRAAVRERLEIQVTGVPAEGNPFDPESLSVDVKVTGPSGKRIRLPGYFHRDYTRSLEGQQEQLTPQGDGDWRIRWLPLETGAHTLTCTVSAKGQPIASCSKTIDVADNQKPGFVRVEPTARRYFQLDDTTPLFLNGLCACWHGNRGTYDYDDWLSAYQRSKMNYIRIWMWPNAFGIEWDAQDRLAYRLDNAWRLDYVLAEAERRGVYVMLCLDYHGMFEVKPDYWNSNNYWPRHPYNAANGGPCANQNEFFTSEVAKKLYEKRLRYIVARWSTFTSVMAWEFFNEIDNEYAYLRHADVVAWHADMGRRLRAMDPYQHLISSSFTGGSQRPDLFNLPEMDFSQYHSYNEEHPAEMVAERTANFHQKYDKPFFVSEYGTDWKGWKPDTDPHFRALHQAIWSGAFTGAAGTGMTWWWEQIHTGQLYPHWTSLADFLQGTGMGRAELQPAKWEGESDSVLRFGMTASDEAIIWLLDRNYNWPAGALEAEPKPLNGAVVTLTGLDNGEWTVEWWDPAAGKPIASAPVTADANSLRLEVPEFSVDIAARLRKR